MPCNPLSKLARECGKNSASGLRDEVYLVPFSELQPITGSTEVYSVSTGGLISAIGFTTGSTKFVQYAAVKNQNTVTETEKSEDNGSYNVSKELTFTLANVGSVAGKTAVENLIGNPVVALTKMRNGAWVIFGLNGQFSMSGSVGSIAAGANGRVVTLTGEDVDLIQIVDPTIVAPLLSTTA